MLAGELFDQPFHFKGEQRGGDLGCRQARFCDDGIDGCFGLIDGIEDGFLVGGERGTRCCAAALPRKPLFREERMQVVEHVAGARNQLGALLDEAIRAGRGGAVDLAGNGIDHPPVFDGLARR